MAQTNRTLDAAEAIPVPAAGMAGILTVYLSGFLQGLTLVSFPASSTVLRQMHGLSDAQYGAIFLPQVLFAVIGAVGGGLLARRVGLRTLLWVALTANALSQAALAASTAFASEMAYGVILCATACLGLGFGISGAPLNSYPPVFFPRQRNTAVVALHTILGMGLMCGPLYAAWLTSGQQWLAFPLSLLGFSALLTLAVLWVALPEAATAPAQARQSLRPQDRPIASVTFWLFTAIAVLYAFAEGTFANWAMIYLQESKHLPENVAALALSVFWGAVVAGRLLVSVVVLRIAAETIWLTLPPLMIGAFLLLPYADTAVLGIACFALAGLACSAFFPLTVALSSRYFERDVAWVSSMMIAALMLGVGLGSFVLGPLQQWFALERLYQISIAYPLLALMLMLALRRRRTAAR